MTREHAATFRAAPGARRAAARAAHRAARAGARRQLDRHGLAGDDGGRGAQRARRRPRGTRRARARPLAQTALAARRSAGACRSADRAMARERRAAPGRALDCSCSRRCRSRPAPSAPARPGRASSRSGWGRTRARRVGRSCARGPAGGAVLIAGFCGALDPELEPGDVVLATELRGPTGTTPCADPTILAGRAAPRRAARARRPDRLEPAARACASAGGRCSGPARSPSTWSRPGSRRRSAAQPLVTLRVVLDTHRHELHRPLRTLAGAATRLPRRCAARARWSRTGRARSAPREVVLASPRASCAGVERAVEIVERALDERGRADLRAQADRPQRARRRRARARGAVFVDELDEVPAGRDGDLLRPRRLAGGPRAGRRARARRDRRDLPAGRQGPRRGAAVRRRRASTSCSSATRATRRSRARSARRPSART